MEKFETEEAREIDPKKTELLKNVTGIIARDCVRKEKLFRAVYNGKSSLEEE